MQQSTLKSIQGLLLVIAVLLGVIAFGLFMPRAQGQLPVPVQPLVASPAAAPPAASPSSLGRYQLIVEGDYAENVFDTQTGQVWWHKLDDESDLKVWHTEPPLPSPNLKR